MTATFSGFFGRDEYERRWRALDTAMEAQGLDILIVWGRSGGTYDRSGDIYYLSNYYGNNSGQGLDNPYTHCRAFSALIVRRGEEPELLVDDSWPRRDLIATGRIDFSTDPCALAASKLSSTRGRVGFAGTDFFPMKYWAELSSALPGIEWVFCDDIVQNLRKIKSPRELDAMREAGRIGAAAEAALIEALLTGASEAEAAARGAAEAIRNGGAVHMIPCSSGELIEYFVSKPMPGYSTTPTRQGDLARAFVYGPMFEGYYADPGRTVVVGRKATADQKRLIEASGGLCEELVAALRPGLRVKDLAALGDRRLVEIGSGKDQAADKFPIYGHGVGLFFEKPYISTLMGEDDDVFLENMVVGIETFVAFEGVGSAGFEQNVIITASGPEVTTTAPMYWFD